MQPAVHDRFQAVLAGGELALPVLPDLAARVLAMAQRPDCDVARLAELMKRDPAMTAHVMRIAASPVYAARAASSSLPQAIGRIGIAAIIQLVIAIASKSRVFAVPGFEAEVMLAFRHAFATALFAQEIARARRTTVDLAFLGGLFHDFGEPVLLQALVDVHRALDVPPESAELLEAIEPAHADVGARLVGAWGMPDKVAEAVRRHHDPLGCELATLVAFADQLATTGTGAPELAAALNLYPDDVAAIAARADAIEATVRELA